MFWVLSGAGYRVVGPAGAGCPRLRGLEDPGGRHHQPHRASHPAPAPGEQQGRPHPHVPHQEGDEEDEAAEQTRDMEGEAGQDQERTPTDIHLNINPQLVQNTRIFSPP